MSYHVEVVYSEDFTKLLVRSRWKESYLKAYIYYLAIPVLTLVLCLSTGEASLSGGKGFLTGILVGVVGTMLSFLWWSYRSMQTRMQKSLYDKMSISYEFSDEGIKLSSAERCSLFKWSMVKRLERKRGYWLLHFKGQRELAFPLESLSEEVRAYILQNSFGQTITS